MKLQGRAPISLTAVPALLAERFGWRRVDPHTVLAWVVYGAKSPTGHRVKLDAELFNGHWCTCAEAIDEFHAAMTPVQPATSAELSPFTIFAAASV